MIIRVTLGLILTAASHIASASLPDFATIVEETSPAVVKIIAQAKAPSPVHSYQPWFVPPPAREGYHCMRHYVGLTHANKYHQILF